MTRRELVAVCMESPFYFSLPLRERLEFLKRVASKKPLRVLRPSRERPRPATPQRTD